MTDPKRVGQYWELQVQSGATGTQDGKTVDDATAHGYIYVCFYKVSVIRSTIKRANVRSRSTTAQMDLDKFTTLANAAGLVFTDDFRGAVLTETLLDRQSFNLSIWAQPSEAMRKKLIDQRTWSTLEWEISGIFAGCEQSPYVSIAH